MCADELVSIGLETGFVTNRYPKSFCTNADLSGKVKNQNISWKLSYRLQIGPYRGLLGRSKVMQSRHRADSNDTEYFIENNCWWLLRPTNSGRQQIQGVIMKMKPLPALEYFLIESNHLSLNRVFCNGYTLFHVLHFFIFGRYSRLPSHASTQG